jgi:hypothetical protein
MLDSPRIESVEHVRRAGADGQRERRAEELTVIVLQAAPQAGVRVQVLAKFNQHGGQFAQRRLRPDHGTIGKATLALLQQPPQVLGDIRQIFVGLARRARRTTGA